MSRAGGDGGTSTRFVAPYLNKPEKKFFTYLFYIQVFLRYILFNRHCHYGATKGPGEATAKLGTFLSAIIAMADNPCPSRQSGAMSNVVVAVNAEGNALLPAARAAGPICLNMLLWGAAKVGDRDAVRVLLAEGADREWCQPAGAEKPNPLCVAAKEGHQEVVKEMLSDDKRIRETMAIKALPFAAGSGHEEMVELLLKEVPRAVLRRSNEAPRAMAKAAREGHQGIVERLLAARLDVDLEVDGYTPLQVACMHGRKDMVEYLLTAGADVNKATNPSRQGTPLFLASLFGHREVVELLLGAGAEVDKTDENGESPLYASSMRGNWDVVKLLLDTGAEVDKAEVQDGCTPLMAASMDGCKDVVKLLLMDGGAEVDKADNAGQTPLFHAGFCDHPEVVQLLLDSGADLDRAVNRYPGATRLHWASKVGLLGMVRSLLDAGADVNSQDDKGETPLHWAARGGNDCSAVAELLLASGAEVDKERSIGITPLSNAAANGNTKVCSVLLRAGADINKETDDEGCTAICLAIYNHEVDAALLLMQWEPSLTGLEDEEAESLGSWLADKVRDKEDLLQEKESEIDNLNRGIEEWCNAAAAACGKKHKEAQLQDN